MRKFDRVQIEASSCFTSRTSASSKLERMRADGNPAPLSERGDEVFKELHHNMGFSAELSRAAVTQTSCAPVGAHGSNEPLLT